MGHILYETKDEDAPDVIRDNNGEVVLGLCRICGRAESQLDEPCTPWRSIETAPVDGTEILVYEECGGTNVMLFIEGQFREKVSFCSLRSPPTHWMPLPSPPNT